MSTAQKTADFILATAKALGIDTKRIQRLVIDADMLGGPVQVCVKLIPTPEELAAAASAIEETGEGAVLLAASDLVVTPAGVIAGEPEALEERLLRQQADVLDAIDRSINRTGDI